MFTVNTEYGKYNNCFFQYGKYGNKHTAIQIFCEEGPLATLTVNVPGIERFPEDCSCVDTNNCSFGEDLIEELGIGEPVGVTLKSGWCTYPVYRFKKGA